MIGRLLRSRMVWIVLMLGALSYWGGSWLESIGGPGALRAHYGFWGVALSLPLQIGAVIGIGGEELFAMANGLAYGFWVGSFLTWVGWYVGSMVQFWMGRTARNDVESTGIVDHMPSWLKRLPASHPAFIICSRWFVPGVGGHIATLVPGAAGVSLHRFCWCTAIGTGLPSLGWTYAGIFFASGR